MCGVSCVLVVSEYTSSSGTLIDWLMNNNLLADWAVGYWLCVTCGWLQLKLVGVEPSFADSLGYSSLIF